MSATNQSKSYGATTSTQPLADAEASSVISSEDIWHDERAAGASALEGDAQFKPQCVFKRCCWAGKNPGEESGDGTGGATIPNEVFNLLKNIVGSGGLSLPAGIAAFASHPSALIPSLILVAILGLVNAYCFSLIGRVCAVTGSRSFKEAWARSVERNTTSGVGSYIVSLIVIGKTLLGNWSFSIIIASTCQPLLEAVGVRLTATETLMCVTTFVLLPLCIVERLSSLAFFSFVGQMGTAFAALTMVVRYLDGSYLPGGKYHEDVRDEFVPEFGDQGWKAFFTSYQTLILVSILSTGYVAHYNAPKYYYELKDHTTGRFNVVVAISFFLAAVTFMTISSLGFLTFGSHSAGFILDNYSVRDPLAIVSRFGIALSMIFAYPLLFLGARDGILELMHSDKRRLLSVFLLIVLTALALRLNDLTFVLSFSGSTLSTALIYILPPMMFRSLVENCTCKDTAATCIESKIGLGILCVGVVLGVCGCVVSIMRAIG